MKPIRTLIALTILLASATIALAQNAPPTRIRGTVVSLDGATLTVATREGPQAKIVLAPEWAVRLVVPVGIEEVKQGSFVGIAAEPQKDGSLKALEVLVLPEAMRGSNEGHYPWDLTPESLMTNATVAALVQGNDGHTVTLAYKDGTKTILVPKGIPIVTFAPGDRALIVPGAKVLVTATKDAAGQLNARGMLVGKDGMMPPM